MWGMVAFAGGIDGWSSDTLATSAAGPCQLWEVTEGV